MKRAPIVEDWSRFNRAVMAVADGRSARTAKPQPVAQPPKREPVEAAAESGTSGDIYGLIARNKWRTTV